MPGSSENYGKLMFWVLLLHRNWKWKYSLCLPSIKKDASFMLALKPCCLSWGLQTNVELLILKGHSAMPHLLMLSMFMLEAYIKNFSLFWFVYSKSSTDIGNTYIVGSDNDSYTIGNSAKIKKSLQLCFSGFHVDMINHQFGHYFIKWIWKNYLMLCSSNMWLI